MSLKRASFVAGTAASAVVYLALGTAASAFAAPPMWTMPPTVPNSNPLVIPNVVNRVVIAPVAPATLVRRRPQIATTKAPTSFRPIVGDVSTPSYLDKVTPSTVRRLPYADGGTAPMSDSAPYYAKADSKYYYNHVSRMWR